jgi:serine/threonine protein kinase
MEQDEYSSMSFDQKQAEESRQAVLNFFVNLYSIQLGCSETDCVELKSRCIDPKSPGPDHTYELLIQGDISKTRRMALGQLGENSGSKSKCFKVIYDDILVVKIPPVPIQDFDDYIKSIRAERQIADQLMPEVECIAPSLSALLKKIPRFAASADFTPQQLEKGYMNALKKSPWLQDHLKIAGGFALFMNLSQYSFLGYIIERFHHIETRVQEEILGQGEIFFDPLGFEEVYGEESVPVHESLDDIYRFYEEKVNFLLEIHGARVAQFSYKRKEWFLRYLADLDMRCDGGGLTDEFYKELQNLFNDISTDRMEEIDAYRKLMREFVYNRTINQNRIQFKGITANILVLLSRLKKKGVSIRDLKPDNIYVKKDSFVQNSDDFLLGLIDFETAVIFNVPPNQIISQPLLAGTPSYATPSHLAPNQILEDTLHDLPRVLHFQDWQAAIGMIYYTVTGECLFEKTRIFVSETWRIMQQARSQKDSPAAAFQKSSRLFWYSAVKEFKQRMEEKKDVLKALEIVLPPEARQMFIQEVKTELARIAERVRQAVNAQQFFKSQKSRDDLTRSNHIVITRCLKNWEEGVNVPETRPEIRGQIIAFLKEIETYKSNTEKWTDFLDRLKKEPAALTVYALLEYMFNLVFCAMYRWEWGDISSELPDVEEFSANMPRDNPRHEKTVAFDETAAYENGPEREETVAFENVPSDEVL